MSGKKVAVIGAGSSGSCAAKYALENGLEPTIFEKAKYAGKIRVSFRKYFKLLSTENNGSIPVNQNKWVTRKKFLQNLKIRIVY